MKKRRITKSVAWILTFCILFSYLPASAVAVGQEEPSAEAPREITLSDVIAGVATIEDLYGKLDESVVPDAIGYEEAVKKLHVARLYEEEGNDLNKVIFLNADGSKTMYTFDYPVKYQTAAGEIQDISLDIADSLSTDAAFVSASADAVTTFSANLSDGISLSGNGVNIDLVPLLPTTSSGNNMAQTGSMGATSGNLTLHTAIRLDEKTVSYYYDDKTTIEYSLTYTGFKEDIVVSEYTGQTEYSFLLNTGGYALEEIGGSYFLVDDAGNVKATIGDIIIFTADERNNALGQIVPTTIREKEQYLLTIVIDEAYLADENTAYPIRIDPTVEITYAEDGAGKIEDATVYSAGGTTTTLGSIFVGNKQNGGIARILMKFPGLDLSNLGENVYIESASVSLRDLLCEATPLAVSCYVYCGGTWNEEDGVTWDETIEKYDEYLSTYLDTQTISYTNGAALSNPHRYNFDITEAVQGWYDGDYDQNKGIIFKADASVENGSTYNWKTISSYNRGSYEPRLTVTYNNDNIQLVSEGTYYINNLETGKYLKYTSSNAVGASGLLSTLGNSIQWELCSLENGTYAFRAASNPTLYLGVPKYFDSNGDIVIETVSGSDVPENCLWWIDMAENTGCLIQSRYNHEYLYSQGTLIQTWTNHGDPDTAEYDQYVWRIVNTLSYGNTASYTYRELSGFNVADCYLQPGASATLCITLTPENAVWANITDFTITGYNINHLAYNRLLGRFTASSATTTYTATVSAIHKATGYSTTFTIAVMKRAVLIGVPDVGHEHYYALNNIKPKIENNGYNNVDLIHRAVTIDEMDSFLDNNANGILIFRGHGEIAHDPNTNEQIGTYIWLNNDSGITYSSQVNIASLDLSNIQLVIFLSCYAGQGGEGAPNLPTVAVAQGARTAIGFKGKIRCDEANRWLKEFFNQFSKDGCSIESAIQALYIAPDKISESEWGGTFVGTTMNDYVICGDRTTTLS